jgi:hypothetical protein
MKKLTGKIACALSVLVLASAIVVASVGSPGFALFASPSSQWITPPQLAQYRVQVKGAEGFSGDVLLGCRPSSPLIACSILPRVVHVDPGAGPAPEIMMLASAGAGTAFDTYYIKITGTALPIVGGGTQPQSETTVTLRVLPVVDPPTD